ncbi:MAG: EAL domain-containing protein, partial [Lachnospiraceae bacterium]|nr:EAL domain-containing protein [Lachnospiraceae bacterium]
QKTIPGFRINVNISYIQVIKSSILNDILATINKYALPPECIGIEVTESGYLDSNAHFLQLWNGLKEHGITLIIDDFGTGYSNLHCLSDLNPTYIKLDRNFTNKAMQNLFDHELMIKIIEMAHSLHLQICVEGVERPEDLDDIRQIHADYIQGYLFGKPYCKADFYEKFV